MATFPYAPDWGCKPTMTPRVLKAQFGDGYDQRAGDGLSPFLATWGLTFSVRSESEARGIFGWLNGKSAHTTAFLWAVPGDSTATDETFATEDGTRTQWQLSASGINVLDLNGAPTIYREDWQGKQLLYTTARTNLLTYSQDFSNAAWLRLGANIVGGYTAPDGSSTAQRIQEDSSTGTHWAYQSIVTTTSTKTLSVFAKQSGTARQLAMRHSGGLGTVYSYFNLTNGTVDQQGTGHTASIVALGNGWYRCSITFTDSTTLVVIGNAVGNNTIYTGNGGDGVLAWGAQLEDGGSAASYIPSTSSSASRTDYTLSGTGLVTISTTSSGATLSWTGSYYRRFVADKWTPPKPDTYGSWSLQAEFRQVPA